MDNSLLNSLNISSSELPKELYDILSYYDELQQIIEETEKALGKKNLLGISSSVATTNIEIDGKSFGNISSTQVSARLA